MKEKTAVEGKRGTVEAADSVCLCVSGGGEWIELKTTEKYKKKQKNNKKPMSNDRKGSGGEERRAREGE